MTGSPWLDEPQQHAWRTFLEMQRRLSAHLVQHNTREFDLSAADYEILVNLSEAPDGRMQPSELGKATQWEKSRLSHHLTRMVQRGLVCRDCNDAARYPDVVLTEQGRAAIVAAAPAHAANVHAWFIDAIGPDRLAGFAEDCAAVCAALDAHQRDDCAHNPAWCDEP